MNRDIIPNYIEDQGGRFYCTLCKSFIKKIEDEMSSQTKNRLNGHVSTKKTPASPEKQNRCVIL